LIITRNISGPIAQLQRATQEISEGKFESLPLIGNRDEVGELSRSFGEMAKRLKHLEEVYLSASPLTRLPGGVAIENELKKRIQGKTPLAFCLMDIDNFKAFNDRYGYFLGNEVIQATARIIREAVGEFGHEQDFIGHIGGDDFVILTSPGQYEEICANVIQAFDRMILGFYDPEDQKRGHIVGENRRGEEITFPLMTLSIAVVSTDQRPILNYLQVGEIATELKNHAKSLAGSKYVVDKRKKPFPHRAAGERIQIPNL
jgi:GGDEF domain-containing protein